MSDSEKLSFNIKLNKNNRFKKFFQKYGNNYLGLTPFLILYIAFILWPMIYGLIMSFTNWTTKSDSVIEFVGLENFRTIFDTTTQQGERYITSLKNLSWFVIFVVPLNLFFAILISLVLNQFKGKVHNFFRSIYFIPYTIPLFLATGVWMWLMSPGSGLASVILGKIGIGADISWRVTPGYFTALLIIIDLWRALGFNIIILTAGMKNIPNQLYEAAEIDGANTFQKWTKITLPMLEPVLFFVIVNCFIGAIQTYDIPWILSNSNATGVIGGKNAFASYPVMEIVRDVYSGKVNNLGIACAKGFILMSIILTITLILFAYRNHRSKY
jgi:multiple sugar transport system permease protein